MNGIKCSNSSTANVDIINFLSDNNFILNIFYFSSPTLPGLLAPKMRATTALVLLYIIQKSVTPPKVCNLAPQVEGSENSNSQSACSLTRNE